ncbi:MAG: SOS response-associated peptidase [Steroidobacteraceae bacterium]
MCGRYITPDEGAIEREWTKLPRDIEYFQSFNLAPTQAGPVAYHVEGALTVNLLTWGFQPYWAKKSWINARSESVFESRAFASAARQQRCLAIALGWYEWTGERPPKQPYCFMRSDGRTFALAGIRTRGSESDNYAILTTDAVDWAARIHPRMPLLVGPQHYEAWLSPDTSLGEVEAIIRAPFDDGGFEVYPVSKAVNSPKHDTPECTQRVSVD